MKEKDNLHHMHIELTREQYATLCAKAKKSGLTKRAFIVRLLEGEKIRERPTEEIRRLREEVHRIGNNVSANGTITNGFAPAPMNCAASTDCPSLKEIPERRPATSSGCGNLLTRF